MIELCYSRLSQIWKMEIKCHDFPMLSEIVNPEVYQLLNWASSTFPHTVRHQVCSVSPRLSEWVILWAQQWSLFLDRLFSTKFLLSCIACILGTSFRLYCRSDLLSNALPNVTMYGSMWSVDQHSVTMQYHLVCKVCKNSEQFAQCNSSISIQKHGTM